SNSSNDLPNAMGELVLSLAGGRLIGRAAHPAAQRELHRDPRPEASDDAPRGLCGRLLCDPAEHIKHGRRGDVAVAGQRVPAVIQRRWGYAAMRQHGVQDPGPAGVDHVEVQFGEVITLAPDELNELGHDLLHGAWYALVQAEVEARLLDLVGDPGVGAG